MVTVVRVELFGITKNNLPQRSSAVNKIITLFTFCNMFYYITTVRFRNPVNTGDFV